MGYPYERFLWFLVSRKIDPDQALRRYELPPAGGIWLAGIRTDLLDFGPYPISSYLESDDAKLPMLDGVLEWAKVEGFRELWEMQPEFGELENPALSAAFQLFVSPNSRPVAGMLLLSKASDGEICRTLQEYLSMEVTPAVLDIYRRIFWDITQPDDDEWEDFLSDTDLSKRERHLITMGRNGQTIHMARDALELETDVNPQTMLKTMLNRNYMRYLNCDEKCGPDSEIQGWQKSTLAIMKEMREHEKIATENDGLPTAGDFEGLFSVQVSRSAHPTLAELEGEIAPLVNQIDPDVDEDQGDDA